MAIQSGLATERRQVLEQYFDEAAVKAVETEHNINLLEDNKIWQFPRWGGLKTNPYRLSALGLKIFSKHGSSKELRVPLVIDNSFVSVKIVTAISKNLSEPYYLDTYSIYLFGYGDKSWFVLNDSDIMKIFKVLDNE